VVFLSNPSLREFAVAGVDMSHLLNLKKVFATPGCGLFELIPVCSVCILKLLAGVRSMTSLQDVILMPQLHSVCNIIIMTFMCLQQNSWIAQHVNASVR